MLPYAQITDSADRRWTFRLLDRLTAPDLPGDERADLVEALTAVSDRRAVPILERVLADRSRKATTREAAGTVLRDMPDLDVDWSEDTLRRWWFAPDPILRRHSLLSMSAADCPDVVRAVAADPAHPLRATALGRMTFFFDAPADLRLKVAALADPDPAVRETAAAILFWDEPVAAEAALVVAAADPVEEVAVEAIRTLQYYPTLRVIRCLHRLLDHPSGRVRDPARGGFENIRSECLRCLRDGDPRASARVRLWLDPVWGLLSYSPEELDPPAESSYTPPPAREARPPSISDLLRLLADPDTSPEVLGEVLWSSAWEEVPVDDRRRVRPVLLHHPDTLVRGRGTVPLRAWADAEGLLALVDDPDFGVRKSAVYRLGLLPPSARIAAVVWEHFLRLRVFGVHATETLDAFVAHADRGEAIPKLFAIAADPARPERLRVSAVNHLAGLEAVDEVGGLGGLLAEPPAVTWALHVAVLEAFADFHLAAGDVSRLDGVDNVFVQSAVANTPGRRP
jgi:HEAT repeat protein